MLLLVRRSITTLLEAGGREFQRLYPHDGEQARPRYWATWVGLGLLWCISRLPYPLQMRTGRGIGTLMGLFARRRRHIAQVNLGLCLPGLCMTERDTLLRHHFQSLGQGLIEMAMSWWTPTAPLRSISRVTGLEHLERALSHGKGAILLSPHFTTVEMNGRLLVIHGPPVFFTYRASKNPVLNAVMRRARLRHAAGLIKHDDLRGMVRSLQRGFPVWYAPDQNYGGKQSAFVPFFGVPAATITATSRLARMTGAPVLPVVTYRLPHDAGYRMAIEPPLPNFPDEDPVSDARRINAVLETQILKAPEQYLWIHRRFKTRPPGECNVYT